ncbi:S1C family serine protease [Halalkalibacter alkalisediminis]|uniref:S1C family serine protease n=1 Tax=Halalkalibacter alkalisediminis TaxID=935616 RepID=A0ABV6NJT1_9BACI|nr:trypsin-like peptidase domain-containing protein [Halalkalibacter alkalisediminis]
MKKQWLISCFTTILIWSAGVYAFTFIKESVPNQLNTQSTILTSEQIASNEISAAAEPKEMKEIIRETQKRVVQIELANDSLGSGFLYNDQGDVVTNAHVVAGSTDVQVKTTDNREFSGKVIGISENTDVAVVRVDGLKGMEPLQVSREKHADIGDEVLALGSPLGFQNTVTTGIISGVGRELELPPYHYEDVYQFSAPIAPGNSGGPLINRHTGEVLGINSAAADQGSIGFSIPLPNVIALMEGWSDSPMTTLPNIVEDADDDVLKEETYLDEDLAQYLINYFYESINFQDFVTAYSLLGSSWQGNTSYESFREGYLHTESVLIDELTIIIEDDVIVTATITAKERSNGSYTNSKYKVTYTVGYENDQMKILSGTGEVLD